MIRYVSILVGAARLLAADAPPSERVDVKLFSDFQGPFCGQFAGAFRQLQSKGVEGIPANVKFRHFPLSFHPFAPPGAPGGAGGGRARQVLGDARSAVCQAIRLEARTSAALGGVVWSGHGSLSEGPLVRRQHARQ